MTFRLWRCFSFDIKTSSKVFKTYSSITLLVVSIKLSTELVVPLLNHPQYSTQHSKLSILSFCHLLNFECFYQLIDDDSYADNK